MTMEGTQQDYWNSRADKFNSLDAPLIPGDQDIGFMRDHLVPGGHTLILGVTPQLCSLALEISDEVTAVDFAKDMIETLRQDGVEYICQEWNQFFEQNPAKYDNIVTDAGLVCLEFPSQWQLLADNIESHLKPGGIIAARTFVSTKNPPKENPDNPNLTRFISSLSKVDENWMLRPGHPDYEGYDVRYSFPPEAEVLRVFGRLALIEKFIPDYEEGEHFESFAWQLASA